jgi:hypothetical protein
MNHDLLALIAVFLTSGAWALLFGWANLNRLRYREALDAIEFNSKRSVALRGFNTYKDCLDQINRFARRALKLSDDPETEVGRVLRKAKFGARS